MPRLREEAVKEIQEKVSFVDKIKGLFKKKPKVYNTNTVEQNIDFFLRAAMGGKLEECIKIFDTTEENIINGRSESGWTALCNASEKGHFEIVKWLVANGARLDGKTNLGETSLMHACMSGKMDVLLFLIAEGADVKIKNIDYKTVVEIAAALRTPEEQELIKQAIHASPEQVEVRRLQAILDEEERLRVAEEERLAEIIRKKEEKIEKIRLDKEEAERIRCEKRDKWWNDRVNEFT